MMPAFAREREFIEVGMVAGPLVRQHRLSGISVATDDIAIGIEDAERRNLGER
jgi:hypothetical protein